MHPTVQNSLQAFNQFSPNSKVWVYQANRILAENEVDVIETAVKEFVSSWAAHGKELEAGFAILFNTFIILIVDEQKEKASGCSIDSSVRVIKELGKELNVDFFNRFAIAYIQNDEFNCVSKEQFQALVNINTENLLVFNNTITSLEVLKQKWLVPYNDSRQQQYFSQQNNFHLSL